jgi:hypothetical protein
MENVEVFRVMVDALGLGPQPMKTIKTPAKPKATVAP